MEQGFGHLFVSSSNPHFFNKTNLEQYFFYIKKMPLPYTALYFFPNTE